MDVEKDLNNQATPGPYSITTTSSSAPLAQPSMHVLDAYQRLMDESLKAANVLFRSRNWHALDGETKVHLYEADFGSQYGFHTLRVHTSLEDVRADRLVHLLKDHDPKTRLAWDVEHVTHVKEIETFAVPNGEQIRVVQSQVASGIPCVVPRTLLGIDWCGYNKRTRVYTYVFRTTQHRYTPSPTPGTVAVIGLIAALVRVLGPKRCELIMVVNVNPGDRLASLVANTWKPWLRERIQLYARVVKNWDTYYSVKE